jgi:hypothetical protein
MHSYRIRTTVDKQICKLWDVEVAAPTPPNTKSHDDNYETDRVLALKW